MTDWRPGDYSRGGTRRAELTATNRGGVRRREPGRAAAQRRPPRGGQPWRPQPARLTRRGRIWAWIASVATALAVVLSLGAYAVYAKLESNLTVTNAFGGLKHRPPPSPPGVLNMLVLGSQTRDGQGPGFGYDPGTDLSDNLVLVHIDATHTHAIVVSIPRDTMVYEPQCNSRFGGGIVPPIQQAIIDGAMNLGGPSCAVATVEHLTDIRIDHFIRFDFNSFRDLVRVIGGVEVCLKQAVHDPYSHLYLSAGLHLVTGNQALAFVRTRHGVGNGGDLGRIQLQQEFMSSLIQKVTSQGTLTNPIELLQIADTATKALTVDPGLGSVAKLLSLAAGLRTLHPKDVTFVTMPTVVDPADTNRLLPEEPQDDVIWQVLKSDRRWYGHLPTTPASRVEVAVLNGSGIAGLAARAAASLRKLGFDVVTVGNAPALVGATTVGYPGSGNADGAYALIRALMTAPAAQSMATGGPITLTLGSDFVGVRPPRQAQRAAAAAQTDVQTRNGAQNICSGLPDSNPAP